MKKLNKRDLGMSHNERAFPSDTHSLLGETHRGITKLEYFAAKAMQSYLSSDERMRNCSPQEVVDAAYEMAKFMCEESEKIQNG